MPGIQFGGCCADFHVRWEFGVMAKPAVVKHGFINNVTGEEMALLLAGKMQEAIDAPAGQRVDQVGSLAQSRLYHPLVRRLRVRASCTPAPVPWKATDDGFPFTSFTPEQFGPHLFLKLIEFPHFSDGIYSNGLGALPLDKPSWDNRVFNCSYDEVLFVPSENVEGIVLGVNPAHIVKRQAPSTLAMAAAGLGYRVGDVLSFAGGTATRPARARVSRVNLETGAVLGLELIEPGNYGAEPADVPANAVTLTGGSGAGATVNVTWKFAWDYSGVQPSLANRGMLKPRPGWGHTWLALALKNAVIFYKEPKKAAETNFYYPLNRDHRAAFWLTENTLATGAVRGSAPGDTPGIAPWELLVETDFEQERFFFKFVERPNDGDKIVFNGNARTWKLVVSNPATEIRLWATSASINEDDAMRLDQQSLKDHLNAYPPLLEYFASGSNPDRDAREGCALYFSGGYGAQYVTFVNRWRQKHVDLRVEVTGNWATVRRRVLGKELSWRPAPNAANKLTGNGIMTGPLGEPERRKMLNFDFINRVDWLAIPLAANFDEVIELPVMEHHYAVQAFFGVYLEFAEPDPALTVVELDVSPAPTP